MNQETATQQGAEELQPAWAARTSAIQQIARGVHDKLVPDLAGIDEESGQVVPYQKSEEQKQEPQQVEDQQAVEPEHQEQEQQPQDDGLETIIVDGKEVRVKRDQLIDAGRRTLQKEAAADRRLQEATEALNRARSYEQALLRANGMPSSQDASQDSQMPSDQDASNRSGSQQPSQDIGTLIDQKIWLRDADKARERFKTEYQDLVSDPLAMRLVVQLENERLEKVESEGIPLGDPWEAYRNHGEAVRKWLGKSKVQEPDISQEKQERKRTTTTVTGAGASAPKPSAPKVLSVQEQIEQMRTARAGRPIQPQR